MMSFHFGFELGMELQGTFSQYLLLFTLLCFIHFDLSYIKKFISVISIRRKQIYWGNFGDNNNSSLEMDHISVHANFILFVQEILYIV